MWSQADLDYFDINHFKNDYASNNLQYHNWDHILNMFKYLDETNQPFDKNLAIAIAAHDTVYDDQPGKEFRSAVKAAEICEWADMDKVDIIKICQLIMATERHISDQDPLISAIIRADLHQLQYSKCKEQIEINFENILRENVQLYPNTNIIDLCKAGSKFIEDLIKRVRANLVLDVGYRNFWLDVIDGLFYTLKLYKLKLVQILKEQYLNEDHI